MDFSRGQVLEDVQTRSSVTWEETTALGSKRGLGGTNDSNVDDRNRGIVCTESRNPG
jgi:hypothetical protein